jgi:hypothetical protein
VRRRRAARPPRGEGELRQARRERDDALRRRGEPDLLAAIIGNGNRLRKSRNRDN